MVSLKRGDVIRLYNTRIDEPYSLNIGSRPKFLCRPGMIGKILAVQITKKIAELNPDDLEEFGIDGEDLL